MKNLFLFLFLLGFIWSTNGQDKLSEKQQTTYNRQKLTIEMIETSAYGRFMAQSWRHWSAYQGFEKISEPIFFDITGYIHEAEKARLYQFITYLCIFGGGILYITSTVMLFTSNAESYELPVFPMVLGVVGSIPLGIGIALSVNNWAPFGLVSDIAEEYNRKLLEKIRSSKID